MITTVDAPSNGTAERLLPRLAPHRGENPGRVAARVSATELTTEPTTEPTEPPPEVAASLARIGNKLDRAKSEMHWLHVVLTNLAAGL